LRVVALGTGTSQGIPIIGCKCEVCTSTDKADKRLRTSIYVESEETKILIDIGPDFRTQFLANKLTTVDHILITHEHNDHVIGLDDIRAINFTQNKSVPIYAMPRVSEELTKRFEYVFNKHPYPGLPQISLHNISEEGFNLGDLTITPIKVLHGRLPILGFKINDLVYITDANQIAKEEIAKMGKPKVLIINSLRKEPHFSHYSLSEALEVIDQVKPERAYLTHISHMMGKTAEWSRTLPAHVRPLNDQMIIEI